MLNLVLANGLKSVDVMFFIILAVIIVLIVAIYFLIPVFNKGQYEMQRENLRKREESFKSNMLANKQQTETKQESPSTEVAGENE